MPADPARLPPPPFWRVAYFDRAMARPDRAQVAADDVVAVLASPQARSRQADGRMRYWGWVAREGRWLRVIVEPDGETVLNAFWDRRFRP